MTKPGRPDIPVCTFNAEGGRCTDARGDFTITHAEGIGTTLEGYTRIEEFDDQRELRIRQLERRCGQE